MTRPGKWIVAMIGMSEIFKCGNENEIYEVYLAGDLVTKSAAASETIIYSQDPNSGKSEGRAVAWMVLDADSDLGAFVWHPRTGLSLYVSQAPAGFRYESSASSQGIIVDGDEMFLCVDQNFWIRYRRRYDLEQ